MSRIIRVGLYERVSTDEQALRGYSIDAQMQNLEEFCKDKDMRIVDHYTDAGVSGGKAAFRRPEMSRLLADVEAGKIDMILFTKLDRWFRNIKEYFKVQELLEPLSTPGRMEGSSTLKKDLSGVQPRSIAASGRCTSICENLGMTLSIT